MIILVSVRRDEHNEDLNYHREQISHYCYTIAQISIIKDYGGQKENDVVGLL